MPTLLQKLAVGMLSFAGLNAAYFLHVQDQHREKLQADSMEATKTFESVQRASHERSQRWKAAVGHRIRPRDYRGTIAERETGLPPVSQACGDCSS